MLAFLLILLVSASLYFIGQWIIESVRRNNFSRTHRCKEPWRKPHKLPFGLDHVLRGVEADKKNKVETDALETWKADGRPGTWSVRMLDSNQIITVEPKNIQAMLATQFNDFYIGPARSGGFGPMFGPGIFTTDGERWAHSRAVLRPNFARDQIAPLDIEEEHVSNLLKHALADSSGWTHNLDLSPIFFRHTLDSACDLLFGQSPYSQLDALPADRKVELGLSPTSSEWSNFANAFDQGQHEIGTRLRLANFYWLSHSGKYRRCYNEVFRFADHFVNVALDKYKSGNLDKKSRYVFLDELVQVTQDPFELRSQSLNILLAGRDTTAGLLSFTFSLLARHPDVFKKLRDAIINEFGPFESVERISFKSLKACSYLQFVMNETLRLWPGVPLNSRRAQKDTTLPTGGGPDGRSPVYVPKGTEVAYIIYIMHRRTDLWGIDAEEFRPERWEGRKIGWEYLPFNGGPRICLGQQHALTTAGYVITRLLQKYDNIKNLDHEPIKTQYSITSAAKTCLVRLHEADKGKLEEMNDSKS